MEVSNLRQHVMHTFRTLFLTIPNSDCDQHMNRHSTSRSYRSHAQYHLLPGLLPSQVHQQANDRELEPSSKPPGISVEASISGNASKASNVHSPLRTNMLCLLPPAQRVPSSLSRVFSRVRLARHRRLASKHLLAAFITPNPTGFGLWV